MCPQGEATATATALGDSNRARRLGGWREAGCRQHRERLRDGLRCRRGARQPYPGLPLREARISCGLDPAMWCRGPQANASQRRLMLGAGVGECSVGVVRCLLSDTALDMAFGAECIPLDLRKYPDKFTCSDAVSEQRRRAASSALQQAVGSQ